MGELDYRELSTILAALRHWQRHVGAEGRQTDPIAGEGGQVPLNDVEIDKLCEAVKTMIAVAFPEFSGHPEIDPRTEEDEERWPVSDWQYEVANGDTRRGYEDWLAVQKEIDSG